MRRISLFNIFFQLAVLVFLSFSFSQSAQGQSLPAYWRYEASDQLDLLAVADVNRDGMDEFVVVSANANVALVLSDGSEAWSYRVADADPILQVTTANVQGTAESEREIALATATKLILLSSQGSLIWQIPLAAMPALISGFQSKVNGAEGVVVAGFRSDLYLYDGAGNLVWEYVGNSDTNPNIFPRLLVGDTDLDGESEVVLGYFLTRGFSQMVLLDGVGDEVWKRNVTGEMTAASFVQFQPDQPLGVAVGTALPSGRSFVYLYDTEDGQEIWYRTPNKQVSSLGMVQLPDGAALLVGTNAGTLIAYDQQGRRFWTRSYSAEANQRVVAISAIHQLSIDNPPRFSIVLTLAPSPGDNAAEVLVLNSDGRVLQTFSSTNISGLTQLTDVNRDERGELLLTRFAAIELLDPGIGTRQNLPGWSYSLDAQPQAALVADVDQDGQDDLLVGTNDGNLHILYGRPAGTPPETIIQNLGGVITHIALAETDVGNSPELVVASRTVSIGESQQEQFEGSLAVLRRDGRVVWEQVLPSAISSLLVTDINNNLRSEIIAGTNDGQILTYSLDGEQFWRVTIDGSVEHLVVLDGQRSGQLEIVAASSAGTVRKFNNKGSIDIPLANYLADVTSLYRMDQVGELRAQLFLTIEDGTVRGLNWRGIELPGWQHKIEGLPIFSVPAGNSFLVATDEARLLRIDYDATLLWQLDNLGLIKTLYWGDLDADARPDIAIGNRDGEVRLLSGDGRGEWDRLTVGSGVFFVSALQNAQGEQEGLVVVSDNGEVRQFRSQVNRLPLLVNPQTESEPGLYTVYVAVKDVENDLVQVELQVLDVANNQWKSQGSRTVEGNGTLFWTVDPVLATNGLQYRFDYVDASQNGVVGPLLGARAVPIDNRLGWISAGILLFGAIVSGSFVYWHYSRAIPTYARRIYQRIKQQPSVTLPILAQEYHQTKGSPDFLLNLGNLARQDGNRRLSSLADGLFLLSERPLSGLTLIIEALQTAESSHWTESDAWLAVYQLGQELLASPSITELSLLRPQVEQLLQKQMEQTSIILAISPLLPILAVLRDSERVDLAEDRLVYLHESLVLIQQQREQLPSFPIYISTQMAGAVLERWEGLVSAAIEELRGQARLALVLKTKQVTLQPDGLILSAELVNSGRAAAENIWLRLVDDPAYTALDGLVSIPILPPGRARSVMLRLRPAVADRFRVAFEVTYDDRQSKGKQIAVGDMVHLLAPVRLFVPIDNPYLPGTPLRANSSLFYGREDLFQFVVENAGKLSQRNVLILMGQRRTGKTSALLRLDQYLPKHVIVVYIDCQSLGVTPGMPALLHDIAWLIADAIALHGYEIDVPEPVSWQSDPTGMFQRQFLPAVRALLPANSTLLLVLDEFEAFENLVGDNILPPTLFPYLRHLMQHEKGLGFIFAGTRHLEDMSADYWSVLFNIALYRQIDILDRHAAIRLITEPVAPNLIYDDLAIEKILRVTAGHPYFLQLVCYTLVNRANVTRTGYVTINDVNATLEEMLRLGEVHFAYIWQRSNPIERALLTAVAHLMDRDLPFRPAELQQYLAEYGIYLTPAEVVAGLNRLVEREIMRQLSASETLPLYELKIGLVGLWTTQNKSLSKLYEEKSLSSSIERG